MTGSSLRYDKRLCNCVLVKVLLENICTLHKIRYREQFNASTVQELWNTIFSYFLSVHARIYWGDLSLVTSWKWNFCNLTTGCNWYGCNWIQNLIRKFGWCFAVQERYIFYVLTSWNIKSSVFSKPSERTKSVTISSSSWPRNVRSLCNCALFIVMCTLLLNDTVLYHNSKQAGSRNTESEIQYV